VLQLSTSARLSSRPGLVHGFTTRRGGVSTGGLASLNLARRPGEREEALVENWRRVVGEADLALAHQVHGDRVLVVGEGAGPLDVVGEADALVTTTPGLIVAVRVADCVPVLLVAPGGVAAVHAGWRGTVAGIVERAVAVLCEVTGTRPEQVTAAIGPAIGVCCYEVGSEVASRVAERAPEAVDASRAREHVDLRRANAVHLRRSGVGAIDEVGGCTRCDPDSFSHRRDPTCGRLAGFVGRT